MCEWCVWNNYTRAFVVAQRHRVLHSRTSTTLLWHCRTSLLVLPSELWISLCQSPSFSNHNNNSLLSFIFWGPYVFWFVLKDHWSECFELETRSRSLILSSNLRLLLVRCTDCFCSENYTKNSVSHSQKSSIAFDSSNDLNWNSRSFSSRSVGFTQQLGLLGRFPCTHFFHSPICEHLRKKNKFTSLCIIFFSTERLILFLLKKG